MQEFLGLLEEQIPRLRRYARVLTREAARGDDLVQDCLCCAVQKQHLFEPGSNLRAWLFTIMHNEHINRVRRDLREGFPVPIDDVTGTLQTPSTQDAALQLRDVRRAFVHLSVGQRQVLALVCIEGFSYGQTATILGISPGTVSSRVSRGREGLRSLLRVEPRKSPRAALEGAASETAAIFEYTEPLSERRLRM